MVPHRRRTAEALSLKRSQPLQWKRHDCNIFVSTNLQLKKLDSIISATSERSQFCLRAVCQNTSNLTSQNIPSLNYSLSQTVTVQSLWRNRGTNEKPYSTIKHSYTLTHSCTVRQRDLVRSIIRPSHIHTEIRTHTTHAHARWEQHRDIMSPFTQTHTQRQPPQLHTVHDYKPQIPQPDSLHNPVTSTSNPPCLHTSLRASIPNPPYLPASIPNPPYLPASIPCRLLYTEQFFKQYLFYCLSGLFLIVRIRHRP